MIHTTTSWLEEQDGAALQLNSQFWIGMPESPDETLMAAFGSEGMGAAGDNMADFSP